MVVVQKQSSMAFKMKSSIAKLTDTTSEHNKKLKAEYDNKMQAYQDSTASYGNRVKINELLNPDQRMTDSELETTQKEIIRLQKENIERGIYDDPMKGVLIHARKGTRFKDPKNNSFLAGSIQETGNKIHEYRNIKDSDLAYGAHHYKNPSMDDSLKPTKPEKPNYRENQKIVMMKSKNLEFIPTGLEEPQLKKALPQELSKSDYFTITSKHHHSGDKYILKDSAGREVDRVTDKEYKEKYGDILQRGTKKYGKENLQRRLYIKK